MKTEICGYKVHSLAGMVPMANADEQLALQENIRTSGQQVPIKLYRKMIVDGRCRALACENLGIVVATENVDNNMTLKQVEELVLSLNIRRNLSPTQRAISAYKQWKLNPSTKRSAYYIPWSTANKMFQAAEDLDILKNEWLEALFIDKKIKIGVPQKNSYGNMVQKKSNSVMSVRDWAKVLSSEASRSIVDAGDKIYSSFDDDLAAVHKDIRVEYHNNIRLLYSKGTQVVKDTNVLIVDVSRIKELALKAAKATIQITPKQP